MPRLYKRRRLMMFCFPLLLYACFSLVEVAEGAGGGPVIVQFAQSTITVRENESFAVSVLAENWGSKFTKDIRVRLEVSDPALDIVNTKFTSARSTLQDMRNKGVVVYARSNGANYLTAAKEWTTERSFFIRNKAQSTTLCMGGFYNMDVTGNRIVTVTLLPPDDGQGYALGPIATLTITFTDVDWKRPTWSSETKEEWVRSNLEWLREKFPNGTYWNHFVGNANDPDGITRAPCQNGKHRHLNEITSRMGIGSSICNNSSYSMYVQHKGKLYLYIDQTEHSFLQCVGYAMAVARDVFGSLPYDGAGWKTFKSASSWGALEVGDYVRIEGHSFFVIDQQDDLVVVTECNFEDDPCAIYWDGQYLLSENGRAVSRVSEEGTARAQKIESVSRMML